MISAARAQHSAPQGDRRINMDRMIGLDRMVGGWRMLGIELVSILAIMALALGALALVKYLSIRK